MPFTTPSPVIRFVPVTRNHAARSEFERAVCVWHVDLRPDSKSLDDEKRSVVVEKLTLGEVGDTFPDMVDQLRR